MIFGDDFSNLSAECFIEHGSVILANTPPVMSKRTISTLKFENNWLEKSLENLEKSVWPPLGPDEGSYLINTCNRLRKKQLKNYTTEDLRIMIGQDIGLKFLIPLAIKVLQDNILAEGDYYEGDLLKSVLTSDPNYWKDYQDNWQTVCNLVENKTDMLKGADTTHEIRKGWFDAYKIFKTL